MTRCQPSRLLSRTFSPGLIEAVSAKNLSASCANYPGRSVRASLKRHAGRGGHADLRDYPGRSVRASLKLVIADGLTDLCFATIPDVQSGPH